MERRIKEADWKYLRRLAPVALDRFCQRVLGEVVRMASDESESHHDRFLAVFERTQERNDELASAFDDMRRSMAFVKLARLRSLGLITDDEFAGFSDETREVVEGFLNLRRD